MEITACIVPCVTKDLWTRDVWMHIWVPNTELQGNSSAASVTRSLFTRQCLELIWRRNIIYFETCGTQPECLPWFQILIFCSFRYTLSTCMLCDSFPVFLCDNAPKCFFPIVLLITILPGNIPNNSDNAPEHCGLSPILDLILSFAYLSPFSRVVHCCSLYL